jgi:hypothetical protein
VILRVGRLFGSVSASTVGKVEVSDDLQQLARTVALRMREA